MQSQLRLMDDQSLDFSFRSVRRCLHRAPGPPAKLQFQELQFVEDVVLVYGGWADGAAGAGLEPLEGFKQRQVESLHVKGTDYISHRLETATGDLLVCLESGLPSELSPSMAFITAQWFSARVSKQGVEEVHQGKLERTAPGSLAEIISLLALLDFLTATPNDTGFGSTASRIATLKVREGGAKCVAHVDIRAVFGAPDIQAARHTAVIQLFQGKDAQDAKMTLLKVLQSLRPQDTEDIELHEAVQLLCTAASCLTAAEVSQDVAAVLSELGINWEEWRRAFSDPHENGLALGLLGFELYRCAVCSLLEYFSSLAGFYAGETGLDPVRASLTVVETCAVSKWAKDPLKRPEASDEMVSTHAGCVVALRCHILQAVIDSRFSRLYGGPFKIESGPDPDPSRERRWRELFESVDQNRNGGVEMIEWKKALENEDNEELRALFQFDQKPMKILAKKLFESVHEKADSWVDLEEFRKACRMADRSELLWHYTYMMAGREAEKADDRPEEQAFAGLIKWNRHCLELGLTQEDAHLKKYKSHISIEKQLAHSKFQAWKRHCSCILRSPEVEDELNSPGRDAVEEVLNRHFDSQLFIKIAFNTNKSFEDVALFGQLAVLQCHILEKIWEALFPKYLSEANGLERCANLQLGVHYIIPREDVGTGGVFFSLEGLEKWTAYLRDNKQEEDMPLAPWSLPAVDESEAASSPVVSEATRSVSSSRIAPPSDATILDGAKVLSEVQLAAEGEFEEHFRTRLPTSINQTITAPMTIDSFAPFQQLRPPMTLVDLEPTGFDFQTIQAPQLAASLGSVAASPTSWTSSDVVHQPLTPQAKSSRRKSSESDRSLPWAGTTGAGPVPPLSAEESQENPMLATLLPLSEPLQEVPRHTTMTRMEDHILLCDGSIHLHCDVVDKQGLLVHSIAGIHGEFEAALVTATGLPQDEIHIQAMRSAQSDREVMALKATLTPKNIPLPRLRSMQKLMLNFIGAPGSCAFFQKFEPVGGMPAMHVSTACTVDNEAGMTATTLVGSQTHSHIVARVDVMTPAEQTTGLVSEDLQLLETLTKKLDLPSGHVRMDNICTVKPKRRQIFLDIKAKDGATVEEMQKLQMNLQALDVPSVEDFIHGSLVIESTVCQAYSDDTGSPALLSCQLDVADDHGCICQNGGPRCLADFVQIFQCLSRHGGPWDLRRLRIWPSQDGEYTIDFQIPLQGGDIRMIQQILWSFHKTETLAWIKSEDKFQFFRALRVLRPIRTFATKLLRDFNSQLQPSLHSGASTRWAEIDVLDRLGHFSCAGGGPFTTNLADFIHIVTGVDSSRLTVLGITRIDPASDQQSGAGVIQKYYNVKIEVDVSDCVAGSEDLRLCESLAGLHRSAIQRSWADLAMLKQYFIIGAACALPCVAIPNQPHIAAHLDLICKDAAFKEQGVAWRGCVTKIFVDALTQACGLKGEHIVVTSIRKTRSSQQHALGASGLNEKMGKMELEKKAGSDTDEPLQADERGIDQTFSSSSSSGCSIHFEVKSTSHPMELKQLASSLRKLHSQAVRRRYAMLPFFEHFEFDLGMQMQQSSSSTSGDQSSEHYILPRRMGSIGSPVLLRVPSIQSQVDPEDFVVFQGHANVIQRGAAPAEYGPCFEMQIAGWFLEAWQYHLEEAKLEVQSSQPPGESLTVRMPDSPGSFDFDGLLIRIIGVRLREAQTEKVQLGALKPEEVGFEAARVTEGFKAYAVDFEVLRLGDSVSYRSKIETLIQRVQAALHGSLLQLAMRPSLKRDLKFYRHFEFDRGIQIDDISVEENSRSGDEVLSSRTHHSITPRTLEVAVRFHGADPVVSADEVKRRMVKLLGLETCQLQILGLETFGELLEAKMMLRTLSHAPAVEETEALAAKLQYLHRCGGHSSCLRSLGDWKLVAVISNFADEEKSDDFQVLCSLQRSVKGSHRFEELQKELAETLGFSERRLQIADVRPVDSGAFIKLRILGFGKQRAEMLKEFLVARGERKSLAAETTLCDVKVTAATDVPVGGGQDWRNDVMLCATPMHSADVEKLGAKSLKDLMKEYIQCCQHGPPGQHQKEGEKPYHFCLLKQIEAIIRKLPDTGPGCPPDALKTALAQEDVALPLLLQFGQTLMKVVEVHGRAPEEFPQNIKEYFLSQEWQAEEMRYALRVLAFVLSWDTRGTNGPQIQASDLQAHFASFVGVLVKVMDIYKRFLVSLEEYDLKRGLYRPCNVLQSLQALLLGIESQPSNESALAWLAGTDFLDNLSKLLLQSQCRSYRFVHGHAVALLFPQATQMTCKAFSAKNNMVLQRDAICNNVLKLMRAMVSWLEINGAPNSPNWSQSLEESIHKMSLPQLSWVLDRLNLPRTQATDILGKLREWMQLDLLHVLDCSTLAPTPNCRAERLDAVEAGKSRRDMPLATS